MSKATLAVIAAVSAGAGAAATAAMYSLRGDGSNNNNKKKLESTAAPIAPSSTLAPRLTSSPVTVPVPASQVFDNSPSTPSNTPSNAPVDPSGLFQYGFPGPISDLATRQAFISCYDRRTRNPHWVAEHITPQSLAIRDGDRKNSNFLEDPLIPAKFQAKLKDYFRSGYDRGHQVPAADCKWSQSAMDETFYLTNMCPQVGDGFNRDYWAHFEDFCRRLTEKYPSVRIVTGPLYLPKRDDKDGKWYVKYEVIGNPPNVAVPTHFYKVIYAEEDGPEKKVALGAFVLPNAVIPNEKPLQDFEVPLEAVERATGLEFASKLPVQRRKRLCAETSCSIIVKEYAERQKAFAKKA
ncbi:mitochondrial nuclease-like protein [Thermochaetoides thermophila DSM 1495]|uniref:Endonuclease n=1 Tax=Chaetomium thermophilum (strain DSM 1495 / CBS 144.50 / IMI 039719) TaxID=759272 RepID=G0SHB9_CHATD|nr:mitochondrial nuclease-like protein [Thermochaetoides thermophila DSM 1495]EGS17608.1 mitochondrial nuclease-like protein [Thermochaetoides thermophila DSM 1495]